MRPLFFAAALALGSPAAAVTIMAGETLSVSALPAVGGAAYQGSLSTPITLAVGDRLEFTLGIADGSWSFEGERGIALVLATAATNNAILRSSIHFLGA